MSSGGSKNQTVTQTNNPPSYLQPYLQHAAQQSNALYAQGPQQYYPGNTVVPFSQQTQQAMNMTEQRAKAGSDLTKGAQGYAQDVIGGKYLNSNPHLDATFNRAADAVQNRLQSSFAGSGRNISAARPYAAQELNDLATNIYGGNYQAERERMQQMVPQAGFLAQQDYADAERLAGVGAQYEDLNARQIEDSVARHEYAQNAPGISLDQYIARLNNQPGSTMSTSAPVYRNYAAGGLGGALAGQQIGSGFSNGSGGNYGGWGALIGGLAGLLGS
jgi:hypothetical protein